MRSWSESIIWKHKIILRKSQEVQRTFALVWRVLWRGVLDRAVIIITWMLYIFFFLWF